MTPASSQRNTPGSPQILQWCNDQLTDEDIAWIQNDAIEYDTFLDPSDQTALGNKIRSTIRRATFNESFDTLEVERLQAVVSIAEEQRDPHARIRQVCAAAIALNAIVIAQSANDEALESVLHGLIMAAKNSEDGELRWHTLSFVRTLREAATDQWTETALALAFDLIAMLSATSELESVLSRSEVRSIPSYMIARWKKLVLENADQARDVVDRLMSVKSKT